MKTKKIKSKRKYDKRAKKWVKRVGGEAIDKGVMKLMNDISKDEQTKFYILWCPTSRKPPTVQMWTLEQAQTSAVRMCRRTGHAFFVMEAQMLVKAGEPRQLNTILTAPPGQRYFINDPGTVRDYPRRMPDELTLEEGLNLTDDDDERVGADEDL